MLLPRQSVSLQEEPNLADVKVTTHQLAEMAFGQEGVDIRCHKWPCALAPGLPHFAFLL